MGIELISGVAPIVRVARANGCRRRETSVAREKLGRDPIVPDALRLGNQRRLKADPT